MSEFKGTQTAWYIDGSHIVSESGNCQSNETLCDYNPQTEYNTVYERSPTEAKANAFLICAAPEMLKACIAMLDAETRKELEAAKKLAFIARNKALNI